ncbi:hypothetical protein [Bacillus sonorensis]|uniref:hypothetical protein n=2 Tax=Bacillus sonorensis TaxID=119858 RepID=UPI0022813E50|nr:hypothetical protein [Bacillus sonorensis]MCY8087627.1 hypothetical protein [Bacillus sonorensis]MCY8271423.1 hypothetical protein [Bacillus sonorensis]MCY8603959.1 hypothetical protein [Bacillus sonorensis]
MLRKGDYVVMHSNLQARINSGVIWACECDEFLDNRGNPAIRLKDYNDVFYTAFLQKVDVQGMLGVALKRADKLQEENERYKKALNRIAEDILVDTLEKAEVIAIEALEAAE